MYATKFSWIDFEVTEENRKIYSMLRQCIARRNHYQINSLQAPGFMFQKVFYDSFHLGSEGIYIIYENQAPHIFTPSIKEFYTDSDFLIHVAHNRPIKSLCFRRLENLRHNFLMYKNLVSDREKNEQKQHSRRDFYKIMKIDTHVHHSACMNSKHLLKFIKNKLLYSPHDVVYERDGTRLTLKQIFDELNITADNLCIDTLDTHAHTDSFQRFDRFNSKYNPYGQPILREIFLKYDNYIEGRYLSDLTKEVFATLEDNKYICSEYRISIYGKSKHEWSILSSWVIKNKLKSEHVKWLIQIPRLFLPLLENRTISTFGQMLENLFEPLFEVTLDPSKNIILHEFLKDVVGFDCVDDESLKERRYHKKFPLPNDWSHRENPPFSYYIYFIYSNITQLNHLRKNKGMNIFTFRPHSGETGDFEHLAYTFLTSQSISHGVQLRKSLPLQYLYYICKVGIAVAPLSNNSLFLPIEQNPFPDFFQKGLNVSLSTDDPLQFHFTKDPLMEEYSVITQIWKFSSADQCELARNSVLQSNFPDMRKKAWIGENYTEEDVAANEIEKTNIPNIRIKFRFCMWTTEWDLIHQEDNL